MGDIRVTLSLDSNCPAARYRDYVRFRTIPRPLPSTAIQVYAGIATSTAGEPKVVDFTLTDTTAGIGTGIDNSWPAGATLEVYGVS